MAASKLSLFFVPLLLFFALILSKAEEEAPISIGVKESKSDAEIEVEELRSKIQLLEKRIEESSTNLKSKDAVIEKLEKDLKEKSDRVAIMQNGIELLQRKGTLEVEKKVGEAHARAEELQKQVDLLKKEIEGQNKEKDALEARAAETGKKIEELALKLDDLEKINDEQKVKMSKTERALQTAEEELIKAKFEATSRNKKLLEVHGAWLPPWLADHAFRLEAFIKTEWNEHGKPVIEILSQKLLELNVKSQKWAEPHIETIKTKWIPVAKEYWVTVTEYAEPHVLTLHKRASELYESSKDAAKPIIIKVQEAADPYYQEARKLSKPYVDQIATVVLKPYTKQAVHAYKKFLETTTSYHYQLQDAIHEKLKNHEITKHLATKELVYFVASALLALPVIVLSRILSSTFSKKSKKASRGNHSHNNRRKGMLRFLIVIHASVSDHAAGMCILLKGSELETSRLAFTLHCIRRVKHYRFAFSILKMKSCPFPPFTDNESRLFFMHGTVTFHYITETTETTKHRFQTKPSGMPVSVQWKMPYGLESESVAVAFSPKESISTWQTRGAGGA
ncbi:hypothetical protein AKJ16_DCAP04188, partial [Drosera capensis]